jgi:hypothetical protein
MLEQQAQLQARQAEQDERHNERIAEVERLLIRGAKMLVAQREAGLETDRRISALVDAQLATEASLKAFIDSLRKPGNGQ